MLVLTRRSGESIVINGSIRVTIVEAKGERVRLGIDAPPHILVDRQEVHERRQQFADPPQSVPCAGPVPCCNGISRHART